eukprot:m.76961 g.76961  ORF g.76961 m.76961 type:complete len:321 (-) comp14531_c0_seq2:1137-2099(-)
MRGWTPAAHAATVTSAVRVLVAVAAIATSTSAVRILRAAHLTVLRRVVRVGVVLTKRPAGLGKVASFPAVAADVDTLSLAVLDAQVAAARVDARAMQSVLDLGGIFHRRKLNKRLNAVFADHDDAEGLRQRHTDGVDNVHSDVVKRVEDGKQQHLVRGRCRALVARVHHVSPFNLLALGKSKDALAPVDKDWCSQSHLNAGASHFHRLKLNERLSHPGHQQHVHDGAKAGEGCREISGGDAVGKTTDVHHARRPRGVHISGGATAFLEQADLGTALTTVVHWTALGPGARAWSSHKVGWERESSRARGQERQVKREVRSS